MAKFETFPELLNFHMLAERIQPWDSYLRVTELRESFEIFHFIFVLHSVRGHLQFSF